MKVATAQQMRNIDDRAIRGLGIPGIALMERAGCEALDVLCRYYGPIHGKRMVFLCGGGNNGGDGFVMARCASSRGARVEVLLLTSTDQVRGDAGINLEILRKMGRDIRVVQGEHAIEILRERLAGADLIVDALLGSGMSGEIRGLYREGIEAANSAEGRVVSVDNPSGVDMDTGAIMGIAVRADLTVTFGLPKRGHFLYPGKECCGSLEVVDIGFPPEVIEEEGIQLETLDGDRAREMLPYRRDDAHKGDFGHLLVLAGSVGYTGAAALCAASAYRVGAGLVTLGIPRSLNAILEVKVTEVITRPLPETEEGSLSLRSLDAALELSSRMDAVVLGPGLSTVAETQEFARQFLVRCDRPVVLDADGVNALKDRVDIFQHRSAPTILTPHPGELGRLVGLSGREVNQRRIDLCTEMAGKWGLILLLKGAPTVLSDAGGNAFINTSGNSGLATGGTGDVLSGAVGGFLVQGLEPFRAALCGAFFHGLAGDLVSREKGRRGMIAGDVMEALPRALLL